MNSQRLSYFFSVFLLTLSAATTAPVYADDTEIYLGVDPDSSTIKHNILFVLDTSFSMKSDVKVDNNNDGDTNDPGENLGSRISVLQSAMNSLITGLDNANVGYVRMNGSESPTQSGTSQQCNAAQNAAGASEFKSNQIQTNNSGNTNWSSKCYLPTGGAVMFPIADLDADASTVSGEPDEFGLAIPITSSSDDATQTNALGTSTVTTNTTLELGWTQCPAAAVQSVTKTIATTSDDVEEVAGTVSTTSAIELGSNPTGYRFQAVTGVDTSDPILSAFITFTASTGGTDDLDLNIKGGVNDAAGTGTADSDDTFTNVGTQKVSDRTTTTAAVDWIGVPVVTTDGNTFTTPDLASIVQEIVNGTDPGAGTWAAGEDMVFLFNDDPGNGGRAIHDVSSAGAAASLTISYCDISMGGTAEENWIGLRFQNVGIPQGATIVSAELDFVAANPSQNKNTNGGVDDDFIIFGEDVDDAATFVAGTQFSNRTKTSARVDWEGEEAGTWIEGDTYSTNNINSGGAVDIRNIVDEIVERGGWCGGNDMAFLIQNDGDQTFGTDEIRRLAKSYDDDPSSAPVLRVQYDTVFDGNDTGCNIRTYQIPIAQSNHDARTNANATTVKTNSGGMPLAQPGKSFEIGLIFSLPVEKDVTVLSADIQFTAYGSNASSAGTSTMLINAENSGNAANFSTATGSLETSVRPHIGADIPWSQDPVATNGIFNTSDVSALVDAVTSHTDWVKDNKIAFIIRDGATPLYRQARAFDSDASKAAKLNITVQENSTTTITAKTVRERLLEINDTLTTSTLLGWTPSTGTLYESALYWRGKDVLYGKQRGQANIAGPGAHATVNGIDYRIKMERTTTSHPGSYSGGTYVDGADDGSGAGGGTDCELETTRECMHDYISGTPTYLSPIDAGLECSGNYQIFLTDGAPTSNAQSTIDAIVADFSDIASCSVVGTVNKKGQQGQCAVEMAKSLHDNDLSTLHDGNQSVVTYTIAFNLGDANAKTWLEQISAAGGGSSYEATSATDLLTAFDTIFNDIVSRPTSFVAPSIAANSFNRLFSRDEVYFGMFTPELNVRWDGNVKKYRICDNTDPDGVASSGDECNLGDIMQNDDVTQAVVQSGAEEGLFETSAISVWSALQTITVGSGREVSNSTEFPSVGGAGGTVSDYTARTIYTEVKDNGSGVDETAGLGASLGAVGTPGYKINNTTWDDADTRPAREGVCPIPETNADVVADTTQCIDYMQWLLGKDVLDEDEDSSTTDTRWSFSDVLHSSPVTVTYGQTSGGEFIDKIIVGTNEGALRFINGSTGQEEWAFMPNELLDLTQALYANAAGTHQYGIDGSPVLRVFDNNLDGTIDPADGDFVHIYFALRRGGNKIYALDITPSSELTTTANGQVVPKFLWKIDGDTADFDRLDMSFSDPILAKIGTNGNTSTDVLIFGGGYDVTLDTTYGVSAVNPNSGNAIYIVDANLGTKILDISSSAGSDIIPPLMKHSIASEVKVLDTDGDGLDDRVYVGDMGGNVWRVDFNGDITYTAAAGNHTSGSPGTTVVGRLASVTDNGINSDSAPDDDTYIDANKRRFFVPPSVVQVSDDIFSTITDYDYVLMPSGDRANPLEVTALNRFYAFRDTTIGKMTGGLSGNANLADDYPQVAEVPIKDDGTTSMIDITGVVSTGIGLDTTAATRSSLGWYLDFTDSGTSGEKGLAAPVTIAGTVFFTTYVPDTATSNVCDAAEGTGRAFALDILSASPAIDWDGDGSYANDAGDVVQNLGAGIPSEAVPIFTEEGVTLLVGTGGGAANLGEVSGLPRFRTYWYEEI